MRPMRVKGDIVLNCIHCGREYYLADAVAEARVARKRTVHCPYCGKRIGGC